MKSDVSSDVVVEYHNISKKTDSSVKHKVSDEIVDNTDIHAKRQSADRTKYRQPADCCDCGTDISADGCREHGGCGHDPVFGKRACNACYAENHDEEVGRGLWLSRHYMRATRHPSVRVPFSKYTGLNR